MSTFERHPAFVRGVERTRQVKHLTDIRKVMPRSDEAMRADAWVKTAILDERALMDAMRALDELPLAEARRVFIQSRAIG